jgi:hypothetical protein
MLASRTHSRRVEAAATLPSREGIADEMNRGTSNSAGVASVLAALQAVTPLATATVHGTSGPKGQ